MLREKGAVKRSESKSRSAGENMQNRREERTSRGQYSLMLQNYGALKKTDSKFKFADSNVIPGKIELQEMKKQRKQYGRLMA